MKYFSSKWEMIAIFLFIAFFIAYHIWEIQMQVYFNRGY